MTLNQDTLRDAGLAVWLAGALYFILRLRVFAPQSLKDAPARASELSLPVVGAVILLYILMQNVSVAGALVMGVPRETFTPQTSATAPATAPATTPASASSSAPARAPATAEDGNSADREVVFTWIGISSAVLTLVPVLVVMPRLFKGGLVGWGLELKRLPRGVALGLGGFAIIFPILLAFIAVLLWVYGQFHHEISEHPTFQALDQHVSFGRQVLLCFAAIGMAPIAEEVFFRGILQTTLVQRGWGFLVPQFLRSTMPPSDYRPSAAHRWGSIVVPAVLFACVHENVDQRPIIFVLALGLGYVYERTGSLWACITVHMAFNATEIANYLLQGGGK